MILTPDELAALVEHAVREYPRESCGVIVARGDERRVIRCRNIQDDLHGRDPVRHPRDARTAYYIDPLDLLRIGRLEGEGFSIAVIYHSHADAGAYFSETDRARALVVDEPAYPDTTYVVTSVRAGRPEGVAAFRWDAAARDFAAVDVGLALPVTPEGCP
ncbi:MAG: M67 family metallopeptidase [Candidatus Rokubacteria bacterium]|nr:M67 family metallopeptidase [Candidatus Rokubacteria bacterium]